ncbi:hypothetical protein GCM10008967_07690 [Bacillus carboniphilus]|uniref:N-acetyltransferase domain-containing protein n=1 Tax=Bacillus carboniphilus TaxID=86663 RepID=A0ABN0VX88_9BACI
MEVKIRTCVGQEDKLFLFDNFVETRWAEVSYFPWSTTEKMTFLHMQFKTRQAAYRSQFPNLETYILLDKGEKVGHFMMSAGDKNLHLVDVFVIPSHRSKGIGRRVLLSLMEKYESITLQVFYENTHAIRFYKTLGFVLAKEEVPYIKMQWKSRNTA